MSTPQEKKTPQTRAEREEKRRQEERADRRTMAIYTVVGVVVVLAAIIMMVWTSGILQRNLTAVEIEGTKFSSVDLQYYYNAAYSEELNRGLSANSTYPFDTTTSVKDQVYDEESGLSWYDYLTSLAIKNLMTDVALADQATQAGYTLSEEAQTELDDFRSQLETVWLGYGYSQEEAEKEAARWVALPGTSEHNTGLALDIVYPGYYEDYGDLNEGFEETAAFDWLINNCTDYGFVLRYPKDKQDITGITYEPWHYRYVGVENAKAMEAAGQCLEEYLGLA